MRTKFTLILAMLVMAGWASDLLGQSLSEDKKASIVFDFQLKRFKDSKMGKMADENPQPLPPDFPVSKESLDSMTRIFGQFSAPPMNMNIQPGDELPMEFFVRAIFEDESAAKEIWDELAATGESVERNGKSYHRPANMPPNVSAHMVNAKTLEMGTDSYLAQSSRRLFTDNMGKTWKKALEQEDQAFRIAVDLDAMQGHIKALQEMADSQTGEMPAMVSGIVKGFAQRLNNIDSVRIDMDYSSKNLMKLTANGRDTEQAEDFREAFDAILGFGKMAAGPQLKSLEQFDANGKVTKVAEKIVGSMKAKSDGTEVSWTIPRPNGFEDAMMEIPNLIGGFMGGMGPGGFGPGGPPRGGPPGDGQSRQGKGRPGFTPQNGPPPGYGNRGAPPSDRRDEGGRGGGN